MDTRWIVFAILCFGMIFVVRGVFKVTRKTTHRDRDHNLNPPRVSDGADTAHNFINHQ